MHRSIARMVVLSFLGLPVLARTQTPQQPVFRAGVDVVEVDVSVFDRERHPVRGLTARDFTILEDGQPRPIAAFAAVDLPDPPPVTAKWMTRAPVDVDANDLPDKRLIVIILDDASLALAGRTDLGVLRMMRNSAERMIDGLGPDDLAAVVYSGNNWDGQSFTSDHARLVATVERQSNLGTSDRLGCAPLWNSTETLQSVVEDLATVPHRRKIVVYVSVDPLNLSTCPAPCGPTACSYIARMFRAAKIGDVNIYSVSPAGLTDGRMNMFLQAVSGETGGFTIEQTNAPETRVLEVLAENQSYYLLGYASVNAKTRDSLKRIEVKVDRPGVEVRSRGLHNAPPAVPIGPSSSAPPQPLPATAAIADLVPKSDLPLRATAAAFADATGQGGVAAIVVDVREAAPVPALIDTIDLTVRAFSPDGRPEANAHQLTTITLSPPDASGANPQRGDVLASLALTPGRHALRVAAHSQATGKEGSVYTDVVIPDFAGAAVSLSGLVLSASPGPRAAPRDALATLLPAIPTTVREFATTDHVSALVKVYEHGGAPESVTMRARVVDDHDLVTLDQQEAIPGGALMGGRGGDYRVSLPVAAWHPGAYLLTFSATAGRRVESRDVRIDVR